MDKKLKFIWIMIVIATIVLFTISTIIFIKNKAEKENKPFEIHQKVCFMPRACFDTEQEFKDQFPGSYVPENYPECLIYCTKNLNYELFPIE